ncbi:sensor histidine kinase [Micromonospora rosaria]|uniref:sensor histidine kinase n=1 Tax=Micromonospora rosaria TaxID=47874 RepID=UPI00247FC05B|nr:ATP-binding protein [Micromonospora rosaria]
MDRSRVVRDGLLWLVLVAPLVYGHLLPPYRWADLVALVGALSLVTAAVLVGRRLPVVAVWLVLVGSYLDGNVVFAIPVLSYLAGWRSPRAAPAAAAFALVAAGGTVLNLVLLGTALATWFVLACVLLFAGVFPWLVGRYRRQQHALTVAGWEHAEAVERERSGAAERVRLRERARIAQDMHDTLGHELSLIALRAAALEMDRDLAARHRVAAGEVRASVAAATERLHEIIGVLRDEATPSGADPGGESVADLVARARDAGLPVTTRIGPDLSVLPAMTAHAVHRVVREALTNAARYAAGAPVTVTLVGHGDRVRVDVANAPTGTPPDGQFGSVGGGSTGGGSGGSGGGGGGGGRSLGGTGLVAVGERVRLVGGTFHAGPTADGGFTVSALLPATPLPPGRTPTPPRSPTGPARPALPVTPGRRVGADGAGSQLRAARRRVRRSLLLALGAPVGFALVLSLVYYPVATAGAVLSEAAFDRMRVGTPRTDLAGLPRREVDPPRPEPRTPEPGAAPPGAAPPGPSDGRRCAYYTDGNFPLAQPSYRLCFVDGRLASKERIIL